KYIVSFGGNPAEVTLFGLSYSAISAALQMLHNNGDNEGLFRAVWFVYGGPLPTVMTALWWRRSAWTR
ncbi:hypothetical protein FIBSPDRAFT_768619, partial [Athelia psychrophila]